MWIVSFYLICEKMHPGLVCCTCMSLTSLTSKQQKKHHTRVKCTALHYGYMPLNGNSLSLSLLVVSHSSRHSINTSASCYAERLSGTVTLNTNVAEMHHIYCENNSQATNESVPLLWERISWWRAAFQLVGEPASSWVKLLVRWPGTPSAWLLSAGFGW